MVKHYRWRSYWSMIVFRLCFWGVEMWPRMLPRHITEGSRGCSCYPTIYVGRTKQHHHWLNMVNTSPVPFASKMCPATYAKTVTESPLIICNDSRILISIRASFQLTKHLYRVPFPPFRGHRDFGFLTLSRALKNITYYARVGLYFMTLKTPEDMG